MIATFATTHTLRRSALAAVLAAALPSVPAVASPQAAPAAPAPATAAPAPKPARPLDPRVEALLSWLEGIFAWGPGETSLDEIPQAKIRGYRLVKAEKKFTADQRFNDLVYAAVDDAGKHAIVGELFVDETRLKAPQPVTGDTDLASLREQLGRFLRGGRIRVALDPSLDRPSWRAIKISTETGYGPYELTGFVTADDGAIVLLGRVWDRKRSIAEQRKELIKLADTPFTGPADAAVTVVEYSDLQCPFCKKRSGDWEPLVDKLAKELKVKRYFKAFPLTNDHPWAFRGSSAARCFFAKDPALFFRWKSQVYARQDQLTVADVDVFAMDFAVANGLSDAEFKGCYLQGKSVSRTLADLAEGFSVRVRATPSYFVDGVLVSWFADNLMEEFLRKTYLKGAGLPLPTPTARPAAPATPVKR